MIWRIVSQCAELAGSPPAVSAEVAYAIFDGLFQQSLLTHLSGNSDAVSDLQPNTEHLMDKLIVSAALRPARGR